MSTVVTSTQSLAVAAVVAAVVVWVWWRRWGREAFATPLTPVAPPSDGYDCSQSWATCPLGPPFCYWGDKDWNKGKCCNRPWSGPDGCRDPLVSVPSPPAPAVSAQALAVYNASLDALASVSSPDERWNAAVATTYTSYPACCKPGFKGPDRSECTQYNGCKYQGMFAAFADKKSEDWVRANDIVAVWQAPNSQNRKEWAAKWKNRRLRIRNPKTGKVMVVTVVDTCDDADCKGCCSRNAHKSTGTLIDLEINTAKRFYDGNVDGLADIEWQPVS